MTWAVLQGHDRRMAVRGGALVVELAGEVVQTFRDQELHEVHLYGGADLTAAARGHLLARGVDVVFFTADGRWRGRLVSREHRAGERRLAQLAFALDNPRRVALVRSIVEGKLANQLVVLRRIQRSHPGETVADAIVAVEAARRRLPQMADIDQLRGMEGHAARHAFAAFGAGLTNPLFTFTARVRRPPTDPVNAALSFLYTLLCLRTADAARAAGLDPYVGFLHESIRGNPACGLDLAEEWRPVVDALVLGLFNRRQLSPEDFGRPEVDLNDVGATPDPDAPRPQAVHLGPVGRGIVMQAWAARLQDRHLDPYRQGRFTLDDQLRWQAQQLASVLEGATPAYRPFAWR